MWTAGDPNSTEPAAEEAVVLIGLAIADRQLERRVRLLLRQLADIEIGDPDEADVVLTDRSDDLAGPFLVLCDSAMAGVAANHVARDADAAVLQAAIRLTAHGYRITAPTGRRTLAPDHHDTAPGELLTARERQVLERLAAGASNKMIARDLDISIATTKFHVGTLLAKLGARNRTDAVAIGIRRGLLLM
ncbi:helix-turn-helix domain-containing protein [Bradyrhizobium sp. 2TAF24]|uniref:helix-turn-helix domain-containing protein n=1 Tax=Bradyrhizobium sp. 2TAF24 TaxID=3233011 RepID=UPI003F8DD244